MYLVKVVEYIVGFSVKVKHKLISSVPSLSSRCEFPAEHSLAFPPRLDNNRKEKRLEVVITPCPCPSLSISGIKLPCVTFQLVCPPAS